MSYYMGDYYAGDPGFFSFLGGLGKAILPHIPVVGPAISGALERRGTAAAAGMARTLPGRVAGVIKGHPVLSAAGAAGALGAVGEARHLMGKKPRRRRRMRVTNPRALRRAIRRTTGFAKLAMRTIHLVHPKKKARFGGFRRRRTRT